MNVLKLIGRGAVKAGKFAKNHKGHIACFIGGAGVTWFFGKKAENKKVQKAENRGYKKGLSDATKIHEKKYEKLMKDLNAKDRAFDEYKVEVDDYINYLSRTINDLEDEIRIKDKKIDDLEDYIIFIKQLKHERNELIKKYGRP